MRKSIDHVNHVAAAAEAPAEAASPDAVFEAIHAVMHAYRSQRPRGDDADGLTHLEHKVLGFFARHPGATQSELATHSGRDKGQLARLVGQLRERGLLQARTDAGDRRNLHLELTPQARAVNQAAQRQNRRRAAAAVAGLDETERGQLLGLLMRVHANLDRES